MVCQFCFTCNSVLLIIRYSSGLLGGTPSGNPKILVQWSSQSKILDKVCLHMEKELGKFHVGLSVNEVL